MGWVIVNERDKAPVNVRVLWIVHLLLHLVLDAIRERMELLQVCEQRIFVKIRHILQVKEAKIFTHIHDFSKLL